MGGQLQVLRNRRRKDDRPAEIVSAALQAFTERGYEATRLDDIAERAGISKGTIYLYFDSKKALFAATLQFGSLKEQFVDFSTQSRRSAEVRLNAMLHCFYEHIVASERKRQILRLIIAEGTRFPELAEIALKEILEIRGAIKSVIQQGVANGEFRPQAADWEMEAIIGPAIACSLWKLVLDPFEPIDIEACLRTHIDMMLRGLRPAHALRET